MSSGTSPSLGHLNPPAPPDAALTYGRQSERSTPKPMYVHRDAAGGQSAAESHSALHTDDAEPEPETHSALRQSLSRVHAAPTPPSPRAPGTHHTLLPLESSLRHVKPGPQSSEEKHGQSVFSAHEPPSQ